MRKHQVAGRKAVCQLARKARIIIAAASRGAKKLSNWQLSRAVRFDDKPADQLAGVPARNGRAAAAGGHLLTDCHLTCRAEQYRSAACQRAIAAIYRGA